jgi:hypothetical protein
MREPVTQDALIPTRAGASSSVYGGPAASHGPQFDEAHAAVAAHGGAEIGLSSFRVCRVAPERVV